MKMKRTLYIILAFVGVAIFIFMIISSGLFENFDIFFSLNIYFILLSFALANFTIFIKIYRWKYLSRGYGVSISFRDSALVVLGGGFIGGISPGRIGDVIKADLMKAQYSLSFIKGLTMIFYERLFELIIIFVVAVGILFLGLSAKYYIFLEFTLFILLFLGIIYIFFEHMKGFGMKVLSKLGISRLIANEIQIHKLSNWEMLYVFFLTLLAMGLEFIRIWVVCLAFDYQVNIIHLSVFFSIAVLIGLLSQIPLGVGVVEGSLTYFLELLGIPSYTALGIAIIDRLISIYYVIFIGFLYYTKILKYNLDGETGFNNNSNL